MSGIVGTIHFDGLVDLSHLASATSEIRHRGWDDEGYLLVNTRTGSIKSARGKDSAKEIGAQDINELHAGEYNFGLGFRRLITFDMSVSGHQPMPYSSESLWIVMDGAVYNYLEIRRELQKKGHVFTSQTDAEVVLASYKEWGCDCVRRFNGDWAFCIYDREKNRLFLSRDRFGARFIYYHWDGKIFSFASEIKALFLFPHISREHNSEMIYQLLFFSMLNHNNQTFYKDVCQLEAGYNLVVDIAHKQISRFPYYGLKYNPDLGVYREHKARRYADDIADIFTDAVKVRMRSDMPIGTALSGGLDSSSIVLMVDRLSKKEGAPGRERIDRQKNFTLSGSGQRNPRVDALNDCLGAESFYVSPLAVDSQEDLRRYGYFMDGLLGWKTVPNYFGIMREASKYVRTVFDGTGADALFCGDRSCRNLFLAQLWKDGRWISLANEFKGVFMQNGFNLINCFYATRGVGSFLCNNKEARALKRIRALNEYSKKYLGFACDHVPEDIKPSIKGGAVASLNDRLYLDFTKHFIPRALHICDRASSAFSIETRLPFMDYRLVDYVFDIPAIYKFRNGWEKWIFRMAMKKVLDWPRHDEVSKMKLRRVKAIEARVQDFRFREFENSEFCKIKHNTCDLSPAIRVTS